MVTSTNLMVLPTIAENWPPAVREWFCEVMLGQPQVPAVIPLPEWKFWLRSVEYHGICSLIYSKLRNYDIEVRPPVEIFNALRQAYFVDVARIMVRRTQLENLLGLLEAANINSLILKGAAIGETLYTDVFQRPSSDIDIIVLKRDYNQARKVLLENGYRSNRGDRSLQMDWLWHEDFLPPVGGGEERLYVVELHWTLTSHAQLMDKIKTEDLFSNAKQVSALIHPFWVLSPVDAIVFACLHFFYRHINELRLIWLYDIHLLAEQIELLGLWPETVALSQQWQARLALRNSLEMSRQWYGTSLPEMVKDLAYEPAKKEEISLFEMVMFQLEHSQRQGWLRKHLFQLKGLKGWNKIRYLKSRLFPSRQEIEANYPGLRAWPGPLVHLGRLAMMFVSKK